MASQKVVLYIHGIESGTELSSQLSSRPGVVSANPLDVADNPQPGGDERNEAIVVEYDPAVVIPTELAEYIDTLGYKVVAQETGPTADRL
jgi:hypothetical protein